MITLDTSAQLEALALQIFDPHLDPATLQYTGPATGITGDDPNIDAQYYALIAPVMLAIDGRVMEQGFQYTLNFTNATKGRPRHWFMSLAEYNTSNPNVSSLWPANVGFHWVPDAPLGVTYSANTFGFTIAAAVCSAICHMWAQIIRLWVAGNYPPAVTAYTP